MATPRDIRRLAFQAMYQLDARPGEAPEVVLAGVMEDDEAGPELTESERKKAFLLASEAFGGRAQADAFMLQAAPDWPPHRQASVDRAILRLAYHEMISGKTPAKIAVNEAVELAKMFSTEKSPAFVNGLLDKVLKKVQAAGEAGTMAAVPESANSESGPKEPRASESASSESVTDEPGW